MPPPGDAKWPMIAALLIGEAQRKQIAELRDMAAANPLDPIQTQAAADRDMGAFRDMMKTLSIELPVGYFVCYSHERQPKAGLCHHMSNAVILSGISYAFAFVAFQPTGDVIVWFSAAGTQIVISGIITLD